MQKRLLIYIALGLSLSSSVALARGGMGGMGMSHVGSMGIGAGGSFGESPYAPGTNSLGTALPSSGMGRPMKGPLLGTGPDIDREEANVEKMLGSICRGC
jgi:hypothetical protein